MRSSRRDRRVPHPLEKGPQAREAVSELLPEELGKESKAKGKGRKVFTLGVFLKQKMLTNPGNYQLQFPNEPKRGRSTGQAGESRKRGGGY